MNPISRRQALALLLCLGLAPASAQRHGVHGMLFFGGHRGLYASHLPLFHAPHDVQCLLRLRALEARQEAGLRRRLAAARGLWTLVPERFDLERLQPGHGDPLKRFRAQAVRGHFERGGRPQGAALEFAVEQVLLYRPLAALPARAGQRFLVFGQGSESFVLKLIEQRPDIDLVGRWSGSGPAAGEIRLELDGPRRPAPAALLAALRAQGLRPRGALRWLYTETADLG